MAEMRDPMDRELEPLLEEYAKISDRCWYAGSMETWVVGDNMPGEDPHGVVLEAFTLQAVSEDIHNHEGWVYSLHSPSIDGHPYMATVSNGPADNRQRIHRLGPTPAYALLWAYLGMIERLKNLGVWNNG